MTSIAGFATSILGGAILVLAFAVPAVVCGVIGTRKGYSSVLSVCLGLFLGFAGLVAAIVLPDRHEQVAAGTIARMCQAVTLDDGRHLPQGLVGRVWDIRILDPDRAPTVLCQIEDPLGDRHWVARSVLVPA